MNAEKPDLWRLEHEAFADGFELVCGVDEAGRGPLAGPVCAAAVILPRDLKSLGGWDFASLSALSICCKSKFSICPAASETALS